MPTGVRKYVTSFFVAAVSPTSDHLQVTAAIVPKVLADLPLQPIKEATDWDFVKDLILADPNFSMPGRIDHILGADTWKDIKFPQIRCGTQGEPIAVSTIFGGSITGRYSPSHATHPAKARCQV